MIKEKNMYKPLPESLTIKQSGINGLGLFAKTALEQETTLGMSHVELGKLNVKNSDWVDLLIIPSKPNCAKVKSIPNSDKQWNQS